MKRKLSFVLVSLLALNLCACKKEEKPPTLIDTTIENTTESTIIDNSIGDVEDATTTENGLTNETDEVMEIAVTSRTPIEELEALGIDPSTLPQDIEDVTLDLGVEGVEMGVDMDNANQLPFVATSNDGNQLAYLDGWNNQITYLIYPTSEYTDAEVKVAIDTQYDVYLSDDSFINVNIQKGLNTNIDGTNIYYSKCEYELYGDLVCEYAMYVQKGDMYIVALVDLYHIGEYTDEQLLSCLKDNVVQIITN